MPGPTQPWDQSGDPRESTVDLPRLDLAELADYFRGSPDLPEPGGVLEPLPEPDQGAFPAPSRRPNPEPGQSLPSHRSDPEPGRSLPSRKPDPEPGRSLPSRRPEQAGFLHPYAQLDGPYQPTRVEPTRTPPAALITPRAEPARTPPAAPITPRAEPARMPPVEPPRMPPLEPARTAPANPLMPAPAPAAPDPGVVRRSGGQTASRARDQADQSGPAVHVTASGPPPTPPPSAPPPPPPAPRALPARPAPVIASPAVPLPAAPLPAAPPPAMPPPAAPSPAPGTLPAANAQGQPAGFASAAKAPAGSFADLRSRLARLPAGHPSSPFDDGGQVRPVPIRLRQLELGLPAPGREPVGSLLADVGIDSIELDQVGRDLADHARALADLNLPEPERPELDLPELDLPELDLLEPDLPDAGVPEPDGPAPDIADQDLPDPDRPDPASPLAEPMATSGSDAVGTADDAPSRFPSDAGPRRPWGDPYAADNGRAAGGKPADLSLGPWQASQTPRVTGLEGLTSRGGNGHGSGHSGHGRTNGHGSAQSPRLSQPGPARPDPSGRDADRRDTAQHRSIEPGARRHERAAADLRPLVDHTLARCREAEGRNVISGYGSSGLTPAIQRIASHLPFGGLAPGSDADSLKSPDRFAAKLARLIARNPGRAPEELAAAISDAVRYAFVFEAPDYVEGTWLVHRRLKSHGFELEIRRNRWESPEYKGIFTQWHDPAHHLSFEVQFHTTASWAVVQQTYDAYVRITDPATLPAERARLRARQVAAAAAAKAPPECAEIADFRLESR
jgi:hypothetical protein